MREKLMQDALIIGGGPAGSAAAIELAREVGPVRLLERKPVAHDKVCGEFISSEALVYLDRLGVCLPSLGAVPIRHVRFFDKTRIRQAELPFTAWSLSRRRLDAALLQCAEDVGVDVQEGVTVKGLVREDDRWLLKVCGQPAGVDVGKDPRRSYDARSAKTVFLATGKHDLRDWRRAAPAGSQDFIGLKMHLQLDQHQCDLIKDTVEVYLFDEGYAGIEPIEQGRANLCLLIRKHIYGRCNRTWTGVLEWLSAASPCLGARLAGGRSLWQRPLAVSGVPYGFLCEPAAAVPGLFRLGDQTAVIPSLAGDGIAMAFRSAHLAASTYIRGGNSMEYQRQVYRDFQSPVLAAQRLTRLFSNMLGRRAAFLVADIWPGLVSAAVARTRIEVL